PYYALRDYGVEGQIGLEPTPAEFIQRLVEVFRAVRRVLRDDGTIWVNIGDSYAARFSGNNGYSDGRTNRQERRAAGVPAGVKPKDMLGIPWRLAFALQ
ncbi:DNA methyltransferase, partial [Pseudomonas aeruginosa]